MGTHAPLFKEIPIQATRAALAASGVRGACEAAIRCRAASPPYEGRLAGAKGGETGEARNSEGKTCKTGRGLRRGDDGSRPISRKSAPCGGLERGARRPVSASPLSCAYCYVIDIVLVCVFVGYVFPKWGWGFGLVFGFGLIFFGVVG